VSLQIEIYKSDNGRCRIELTGRLDSDTSAALESRLEEIEASQFSCQIVDLAALEYISSAGLRTLYRAKKLAQQHQAHFLVVHPQPQVKKVFDIVKALPNEAVFSSQQEMDDYLDRVQQRARAQAS
jgi:anti-anti-sigma factor